MVFLAALKEWTRRTRWGALIAIGALLLGSALTVGLQAWFYSNKPFLVKVNWVRVEQSPQGHRWLNVQLTAPAANGCLRISQHLLFQDAAPENKWTMRHYVPLGSALNGVNYSAIIPDFNVLLDLPTGLPSGEWWYVDRSAYFCTVWPYGIHVLESQTEPTAVRIE